MAQKEEFECYDCGSTEEEEKLFFCVKCKQVPQKFFCQDCGPPSHKKLNHKCDSNDRKAASFQMDDQKLSVVKKKSQEMFSFALSNYLVEGTDKALAVLQNIAGSGGGAIGAAIGTSVAAATIETGAKEIVKGSIKGMALGSGFATAGLFVIEAIYLGVQFGRGKIDGREFGRRLSKSVIRNGTSFGCAMGGAAIGAFAGPVGAFIGALIGGIIGGVSSSVLFEKYWPNDDQRIRQEQIREAMKQFGVDKNRLKDPTHFSKHILTKKYRALSRLHHPDRPGGDKATFQTLAVNYGLLMALLNTDKKEEKAAVKFVMAIAL